MKSLTHTLPNTLIILMLATALFFSAVFVVSAKIGVGMGAGEIRLTEGVKPGGIYTLPSLQVFNTGDETTLYGMGVAYHQEHLELRPPKEWFAFSPTTFTLEEGGSQKISIMMVIPLETKPGDYFSFIESGPVPDDKPGTSVGVAVGTRLFFTVEPANIFQAAVYRTSTFFNTYAPWTWIALGITGFFISVSLFRRFFSLNIGVRSK